MRNLMAVARHDQRQVIGALIRTIFTQPDCDRAVTELRQVVDQLEAIAPTVAERLQAMVRPAPLHRFPDSPVMSGDAACDL